MLLEYAPVNAGTPFYLARCFWLHSAMFQLRPGSSSRRMNASEIGLEPYSPSSWNLVMTWLNSACSISNRLRYPSSVYYSAFIASSICAARPSGSQGNLARWDSSRLRHVRQRQLYANMACTR